MPAKVLDSFALVAYFRDEPGAEAVEALLVAASRKDTPLQMTEVNYAEAKYIIIRKDGAPAWEDAAKVLVGLPIEFHPATRALAETAADFKARFSTSLAFIEVMVRSGFFGPVGRCRRLGPGASATCPAAPHHLV